MIMTGITAMGMIVMRMITTPMAMTAKAGTMVTRRRSHTGMRKFTKPCMIIWPAMVPTTELEMPEVISETRKTAEAAAPSSGVSVW